MCSERLDGEQRGRFHIMTLLMCHIFPQKNSLFQNVLEVKRKCFVHTLEETLVKVV